MNTGFRLAGLHALGLALSLAAAGAVAQGTDGKVYTPGPFDRIEVDGSGQIRVTQGDRDEVLVGGDAQAQEAVSVGLSGTRLKIDLPGAWKFWDNGKAQVEVHVRHLSRITLSGAADVYVAGTVKSPMLTVDIAGAGLVHFDDIDVDMLSFEISGAGEGQLAGHVDHLRLSVSGKGKIGAEQLRVGDASVSISGVGNADLWVTHSLRVDMSGAGHVSYWGQPVLKQTISGLGSVDPRGDKH